jgi:hypothetical protein
MHREYRGTLLATGSNTAAHTIAYLLVMEDDLYDVRDPSSSRTHWRFFVRKGASVVSQDDAGFRMTFVQVDDTSVIVTEMFADLPDHRRLGLPEAVLAQMSDQSGMGIFSSSNRPCAELLSGEHRTPDADKVWQRVIASGRASYVSLADRYSYNP